MQAPLAAQSNFALLTRTYLVQGDVGIASECAAIHSFSDSEL